ncbi:hypothetical protein [Rhodomicrobium sp.]|uniref:hypothetical protein n=1 Tax=Rhodomicrobium sp. TaxID=2720632 RepID=UPI0039E60856
MPNGRIQVRDLAPPDPIEPARLPSDTFEGSKQAPINNDWERLSSALGHFNQNLRAKMAHDEVGQKKLLTEQHLGEYETWKAATVSDDQLKAIRAGTHPYYADPLIATVVHKDVAEKLTTDLAGQMDAELQRDPKFGTPDFNPDQYVMDKAKPVVGMLQSQPGVLAHFGQSLDALRKGVTQKHQAALGENQNNYIKDIASAKLDLLITYGIEDGLNGQQLSDGMRSVYKEFGPRLKGGTLDLKYNDIDDLLLGVLANKAKDPRQAKQVLEMLGSDRAGVDNQALRIGPLSSIPRHAGNVDNIRIAAMKSLGDADEADIKGAVLASDVEALRRNNGDFSAIDNFSVPNRVDGSRTVSFTAKDRKDAAASSFLQATRAVNGGREDFDKEVDVYAKNNVKHPEWIPRLVAAVGGAGINTGTGPEAAARIQEAAQKYNDIADREHGWMYLKEHLPKNVQDFYETYSLLVREGGRTPAEASAEMARIAASDLNDQVPSVTAGKLQAIRDKAASMDYSWLPFSGTIANKGEMGRRIIKLAEVYVKADGVDEDTAIQRASERYLKASAYINGRAVVAPGIAPGDEKYVQPILDKVFKDNEARFKELGIPNSSSLSLAPLRNGIFQVVKWDGGVVMVPVKDENGGFVRIDTPAIRASDIQAVRSAMETDTKMQAANRASQVQERHSDFFNAITPYLPENLGKYDREHPRYNGKNVYGDKIGGKTYGGNPFGGNTFGGNTFGGRE